MALETLAGVTEINGAKLLQERIKNSDGSINWDATDEARKSCPIFVDHDVNMISFKIQDGPIKENGLNGCQVTDMIAVAKHIISELNKKFPCKENVDTIFHLWEALEAQDRRTANRDKRGVEGTSNA